MKCYEIIFILNINIDKIQDFELIINNILKKFININKDIKYIKKIGLRKLSYPIKNINQAFYIIYYIMCNSCDLKKIEKEFKLNNTIIRYLILKNKYYI